MTPLPSASSAHAEDASDSPRPRRTNSHLRLSVAVAAVVLLVGIAVVGLDRRTSPQISNPAPSSTLPSTTVPAISYPVGLVASLLSTTAAELTPGGAPAPPIAPTWHGSAVMLPVIATEAAYLEVRLPTRPNGSTTWIRADSVRMYSSPYRIVLNLSTRHLVLYRSGVVVLNAPAGVGTVADPTPTGHFFLAFFAAAPSTAWGPFVMVTSAHSNAITDWEASGDALIAIHGPLGDDSEIGSSGARISHGCVRLHVADLVKLRVVPAGSPIDIIQ